MYLVVPAKEKHKSKVLPSFLVEPLLNGQYKTRQKGKFVEVDKGKGDILLIKRYNP